MDKKAIENFIVISKEKLNKIFNEEGYLFNSSIETLKKGDIYILGLNPGGKIFGGENNKLLTNLENLFNEKNNNFLDEYWKCEKLELKNPFQKRIDVLFKKLGKNLRCICSSNLIFIRSKSQYEIYKEFNNYAEICWEVHKEILNIVKPNVILCIGNGEDISSYSFIKKLYKYNSETKLESGRKNWKIKLIHIELNGNKITVIGLPHLSWYNINIYGSVISDLKEKLI